MNNLHRELPPSTEADWGSVEEEARRTVTLPRPGRRVADREESRDATLAAVGTVHLPDVDSPADGVIARVRQVQPLAELRVPFTLDRRAVDDVERGAKDPDWQPVKDAARLIAFAEDRAVFEGYPAAGIRGVRDSSSNSSPALPADVRAYPDVISQAVTS